MRMAVGLEDGLGLDCDWCMRDTPTMTKLWTVNTLFEGIK